MGSKQYPEGTNHFSPNSPLFNDRQRESRPVLGFLSIIVLTCLDTGRGILISDIGISVMLLALGYFAYTYGWASLVMYYFIPYMLCNHWCAPLSLLTISDVLIIDDLIIQDRNVHVPSSL